MTTHTSYAVDVGIPYNFFTWSEVKELQEKKVTKGFTHAGNKCKMVRAMHIHMHIMQICILCIYQKKYVYYVGQVHYIGPLS